MNIQAELQGFWDECYPKRPAKVIYQKRTKINPSILRIETADGKVHEKEFPVGAVVMDVMDWIWDL